jgi:two-component system, OmpR family, response regulator
MPLRILHIDDDSDIREIVAFSLSLDSALVLRSCADGADALATAAEWAPDLILCDVMMPGMDGPTMLARLRENPRTAKTPVVFMTARAGSNELEHLMSIGAAAVFTKPFDPMLLADMVRTQLRSVKSDAIRYDFVARMHSDAAELARYRKILCDNPDSVVLPEGFQSCVHKLSGAAGVFNFQAVSRTASALEAAIVARCAGRGAPGTVEANLDALLGCIESESVSDPFAVNR